MQPTMELTRLIRYDATLAPDGSRTLTADMMPIDYAEISVQTVIGESGNSDFWLFNDRKQAKPNDDDYIYQIRTRLAGQVTLEVQSRKLDPLGGKEVINANST